MNRMSGKITLIEKCADPDYDTMFYNIYETQAFFAGQPINRVTMKSFSDKIKLTIITHSILLPEEIDVELKRYTSEDDIGTMGIKLESHSERADEIVKYIYVNYNKYMRERRDND